MRIPIKPSFMAAVVNVIPSAAPIHARDRNAAVVPKKVKPVSHSNVKKLTRDFRIYQSSSPLASSTC